RRFTPLLLGRILRTDPRKIPKTILVDFADVSSELKRVLETLDDEFKASSSLVPHRVADLRGKVTTVLSNAIGFELQRKRSTVCDGDGVFVSKGRITARSLCSLYPGTLYGPGDPILLQSLGNSFILKCRDGQMVDGNDRRISRSIFKSCAYRDFGHLVCDLTWLDRDPINFLNMGQYVNDARDVKGNVQYVDLDVAYWRLSTRRWLPYSTYRPADGGIAGVHDGIPLRVVALVATRNVEEGEELLSDYLSC
ncbi:hypothetical protein PFISCL1PPCAC_11915, partial [Pristionchus fissidentatus]